MKKLNEYVENLDFDYAISYSGLRGEKFKALEEINKAEIIKIKKEVFSARYMEKAKLKKQIEIIENEINVYNSRITNINGEFHKSCEAVHRFEKDDEDITAILEILNHKFKETVVALCVPIFRDSIVFYSKRNEINGVIQICFGCNYMRDENEATLEVDHKIYRMLKNKLIQLGHKIENV